IPQPKLSSSSAHPGLNSGLLSPSSAPTQLRAAGAQLWKRKWIFVCLSLVSEYFGIGVPSTTGAVGRVS
ncbi:hypothetical protein CEP51_016721, partial [Fusarium floridanum]